jgi:glycosyltransferase involved in cell wall biosynthesis
MKCCICGTVRNCGPYLDKIFSNMEIIGSKFEDYRIILYYDSSTDNTLQKIQEYHKQNPKLIFYINRKKLLPYRTHRIALGRNMCLNIIRNRFSKYEYFMMMDCDDRCAKDMNENVLEKYLSRNDWDSLSFNHPDGYYDSWALSKRPYVLSCHHFRNASQGAVYINKIIKKTHPDRLINCISAFNGFAIYRTKKFLNCRYDGTFRLDYIPPQFIAENIKAAGNMNFTQNKEDCEHRHFHFQAFLKYGARIRISPHCLFK